MNQSVYIYVYIHHNSKNVMMAHLNREMDLLKLMDYMKINGVIENLPLYLNIIFNVNRFDYKLLIKDFNFKPHKRKRWIYNTYIVYYHENNELNKFEIDDVNALSLIKFVLSF